VQYAAARRTPSLAAMLAIYEYPNLGLWIAFFALGALLVLWGREDARALSAALLFSVPFAWSAVYLLLDSDPSKRAVRLLALWPALLIVSFVVAVLSLRQGRGFCYKHRGEAPKSGPKYILVSRLHFDGDGHA
jgi:peptidoglycan/LPS O-acetylase OafA/YrhL